MGYLQDGVWLTNEQLTSRKGEFDRKPSIFRNIVGSKEYPAEKNRYHLYISYACPFAHRTLIMRSLKGLEEIITLSTVQDYMGENGWEVDKGPENIKYLHQLYQISDSKASCRCSVPVLWDKKTKKIVNNESAEILRMLNSNFNEFSKSKHDYYPAELQEEIDKINDYIYENVNNGVYKAGFANSQESYKKGFMALFEALERLENHLENKEYLVSNVLTEADIRLFTTLIRFDPVYYIHFKCNLKMIKDYPNLFNWLKRIYSIEAINKTVKFDRIKNHYFLSHKHLNPSGIIPVGPENLLID